MTKPVEGGMRKPSVPPAAIAPVDSPSPYPRRRISGSATRPMVTAVATEEPDTAENAAQPITEAVARPPRKRPTHAWAAS